MLASVKDLRVLGLVKFHNRRDCVSSQILTRDPTAQKRKRSPLSFLLWQTADALSVFHLSSFITCFVWDQATWFLQSAVFVSFLQSPTGPRNEREERRFFLLACILEASPHLNRKTMGQANIHSVTHMVFFRLSPRNLSYWSFILLHLLLPLYMLTLALRIAQAGHRSPVLKAKHNAWTV